jgi:hypothetical protein
MKNKTKKDITHIDERILCSREVFLGYLKEYYDSRDYIRVVEHQDYDVCLELTWRQHTDPVVEYYFLGNVVDNRLIGEIVEPRKNKSRKKKKTTFKEKSELIGIILLLIVLIVGLPFLISFIISKNFVISGLIGITPLLILIVLSFFEKGNIPVHKKNIIELVSRIN